MPIKDQLEFDQVSSVDLAAEYCRRMLAQEARGPGDIEEAMHRIEIKTGIGYWVQWAFRYRKPKTVDRDLFSRIRGAYLGLCDRQLQRLQHDLAVDRAKGGGDDTLEDLEAQAAALAAKIQAARARR